jgi:hypothetical protein
MQILILILFNNTIVQTDRITSIKAEVCFMYETIQFAAQYLSEIPAEVSFCEPLTALAGHILYTYMSILLILWKRFCWVHTERVANIGFSVGK